MVNNAGILNEELWEKTIDVNLVSCQAVPKIIKISRTSFKK